jgi:hypothetical protein
MDKNNNFGWTDDLFSEEELPLYDRLETGEARVERRPRSKKKKKLMTAIYALCCGCCHDNE